VRMNKIANALTYLPLCAHVYVDPHVLLLKLECHFQ